MGAPRQLVDALNPGNVPAGSQAIAYYTDVLTAAQARARWPGAQLLSIDRVPEQLGGVVDDCESGALSVAVLPARAAAKRARGIIPWVYCSRSPWPAVRAAFAATGVAPPLYWIAVPGPLQLLEGTVATQCLYNGTFDVSALAPYAPGLDPAPQGETMYDTVRKQWVSAWLGADSKVYYRIAKTLEELLSNPPQPLEEPTGGAPGTKLIISQGVDDQGNYLFSLHGADDTLWYVASPDGGQTWQVANDPQATLLPPVTTAAISAAIAAALASELPADIAGWVQKVIAALPANPGAASPTHTHSLAVDGVDVATLSPIAGS